LEKADTERKAGKRFGIPFASLLKFARQDALTFDDLTRWSQDGYSKSSIIQRDGPQACGTVSIPHFEQRALPIAARGQIMFPELLQFAVESSGRFCLQPSHVCRVLAAVGQTLDAHDLRFREKNRSLADRYRAAAKKRVTPNVDVPPPPPSIQPEAELESPRFVVQAPPPWQGEYRRQEEQAGCLRLERAALWHASYIGPRSAEKSENQDATFAMTSAAISGLPCLAFALADGVSSSLGSRFAATSIVQRFCEYVSRQFSKDEEVGGQELIYAARQTQASLEELARALLHEVKSASFESMLGTELTPKASVRVLQNTLNPKVAAMPSALNATLIGGVVQPRENTVVRVALLRIGDGSVEHIDAHGKVSVVLATDPATMAISEAMGPGPPSRRLFEQTHSLSATSVLLAPGDSLVISSDGLARGHDRPISTKLEELLGEPWRGECWREADAALQILHRACASADEESARGIQGLFADNVSLIVIRSGV
jgi:serine/threonine protein phosphatase PrpC